MKKLIAFIAIIGLAFSACNGKYTIAKRKYNKGFYVSKNTGNTTKPVALNKTVRTVEPAEKIETVVVAKSNSEETKIEIAPVRTFVAPVVENSVSNDKRVSNGHALASTLKTDHSPVTEIKPVKIDLAATQKAAKKGDTHIVLLVILALFPILCLIAVYLHDSGITLNFWITLLLHLTIIGAMIFAVLVVLDIVDVS